jgi:hypothetical protein
VTGWNKLACQSVSNAESINPGMVSVAGSLAPRKCSKAGLCRMSSPRAERYRAKAAECERLASKTRDLFVQSSLADVAAQWRELAEQVEWLHLERRLSRCHN